MSIDMQKVITLAGNIPFDNIEYAKEVIENFCSESIAVVLTNRTTSIIRGTHLHDSYEFVICHTKLPSTLIDNKVYDRKNNTLFAVNPLQEHGITTDLKGFSLCGLHIDKSLIQSVSTEIYGSPSILFSNDSFILTHDISMLVRLFLEELKYKQSGYEYLIENLSLLIVGNLLRQIKHNLSYRQQYISNNNNKNIKTVIDYMNENYTTGVSCIELADLIKMDRFGFIRSFKAETGKTPYEYLLDLKIEKAKKILKGNEYTITEVSMMCGFSSHSHFTSTFKKKTGISPTEYKTDPNF
jgi:AraC-like DNA-binding protein